MTVTFARAEPADAETLVAVQIAAFHDDARLYPGLPLDGPPGYDSVEAALRKIAEDDYYKILFDGQIVGGMAVFIMDSGHYHLDVLYIHPNYHNRGIGTQAMRFLDTVYRAQKWTLNTPAYALRNQHFYEKLGYKNVGHSYHDTLMLIDYEKSG